ncbi:hypothetical protein D3C71_1545920 [compost metagenome]
MNSKWFALIKKAIELLDISIDYKMSNDNKTVVNRVIIELLNLKLEEENDEHYAETQR